MGIVYAREGLRGLLFLVLKFSSPQHAGAWHNSPLPCLVNRSIRSPLALVHHMLEES